MKPSPDLGDLQSDKSIGVVARNKPKYMGKTMTVVVEIRFRPDCTRKKPRKL